jgi:hypothetical protein
MKVRNSLPGALALAMTLLASFAMGDEKGKTRRRILTKRR